MMAANESTDFDFFDTPRNQQEDFDQESPKTNLKSKPPVHTDVSDKNVNKSKESQPKSSSISESSDDDKDDYSSDSVSSLSDTDQSQKRNRNSRRSISSDSTLSSSYKDEKTLPKCKSEKVTDKNGCDLSSKSSGSGGSSGSWRRQKGRKGHDKSSKTRNDSRKYSSAKEKDEDSYSSSAYSDGEEDTTSNGILKSSTDSYRRKKFGNKESKKHAWGGDGDNSASSKNKSQGRVDLKSAVKERPKTAKSGRKREKLSPQNSDSEALSDSDITDVSPIDSPRVPLDGKSKGSRNQISAAGDGGGSGKSRFKPLPMHGCEDDGEKDIDSSEMSSSGIDLQILMKAVGELEKKKRVEANTRRVMFAPMTLIRNEKSNYTFDRDRSHDIDRENDRLLKEIVKQVNADRRKQYFKSQSSPTTKTKITPSAINREKEMRRIESDNINFLKRLQKVKPTSTISRNNQLRAYENTKLHGVPIATLHPVGGSRTSSRASSQITDSYCSIGSRTRSLTSLHSVASTVRSTTISKRSSRPSSATKRIDCRPEWNDRW